MYNDIWDATVGVSLTDEYLLHIQLGATALYAASNGGYLEAVKILLGAGANIEVEAKVREVL